MPYLKIDAHGAIIRAQFMGVRLSERRLLASNYKTPKAFEAAVQQCYTAAVIEEYHEKQDYNYKRRKKYGR